MVKFGLLNRKIYEVARATHSIVICRTTFATLVYPYRSAISVSLSLLFLRYFNSEIGRWHRCFVKLFDENLFYKFLFTIKRICDYLQNLNSKLRTQD